MKKIIFFCMCMLSINLFAQSMDHPGESIELLEGKELKVKPLSESLQKYGYKDFYTDPDLKKVYKKGSPYTKYNALLGKVFKVVSYKPVYGNYAIMLENPDTGTLYYRYNKTSDYGFPFEVIGGLTFPDGFFCNYNKTDKTWDSSNVKYKYTSHTPCREDICMYGGNGDYSLHVLITASSDRKETGLKGLTLTLENGKEISFPDAQVSVESSSSKYNYSTVVDVNQEQVQLLRESPMVKKLVGNKEKNIEQGRLIMELIKCFTK